MAGKYQEYRNKLQRYTDNNDSYRVKVDKRKTEIISEARESVAPEKVRQTISNMYRKRYTAKKRIEELDERNNLELAALNEILTEMLEAAGEESFKPSTGGSYTLNDKLRVSIKDPEAFKQWARDNGYENDFNIHPKKAESIASECLEAGEELPPGMSVFIQTVVAPRSIIKERS